jgi:Fur family transcriptional regulator, zinc uptake regulator
MRRTRLAGPGGTFLVRVAATAYLDFMTSIDHHHYDALKGDCAHAAHQSERAGVALARAEAACRSRGARLTPMRREVLETLYATHHPLGAYEIAEVLARKDGRRLAPITIYRALGFLLEQGLAHRLASRNAFIACPHGHDAGDLVAFLICETCGGVDEMSSSGVAGAISDLLADEGFEPQLQILEISGRCAHCRGQAHVA